jgi:hypothetical protein
MATRRRARRVSLKGSILDIQRRLRYVESKPNPFKISDKAITRDAIQFNAVSSDQIAPNAVGNEEIASDSITNNELANGSVSNSNLQNNSVGTSNIQDGAVTTPKIADNAVTTAKIGNNQVTSDKVATEQIGGRGDGGKVHLRANSITTQDIRNDSIGSGKLQTDAVITAKINNLAVTTAKLAAGAVTTSKIGDAQVTLAKLNFSPITALVAGIGINIATGSTNSRTISANFGTGNLQVARGDHGHPAGFSVTSGPAAPNAHRHSVSANFTVSTKKLKKEIQEYSFDTNKLLNLTLKKFKYKNQAKDYSLNREWEYGYIAEEVQDLGLQEIVSYNNDGSPAKVNYALLSVLVLELVKNQNKEIESLKKEIQKIKENK